MGDDEGDDEGVGEGDYDDHFKPIIEAIGLGVAIYGDDGRFEYVNEAFASLFGTDTESLRGVAIWEVNPTFDESTFEDYWNSFEDGETRATETRLSFEGVTVDVNALTTCDVIHGRRFHFGTIRDIGEKKARQRAIEYQRSLLKAQQESTIDGILVVDENDDIVSYNNRFAELWGIRDDVIEKKDDTVVLDTVARQVEHPEEFYERVVYLYDNPEVTASDQIELADGRVFDRYTTPVRDDGTYYGRLWLFRDVTERVEDQRRLERQNRQLEQFAGIVSHDLRNPLNVAVGHLELATEECSSDHLDAVDGALARMDTLIGDMLSLARGGRAVDEPESVGVEAVARTAWQNVETGDAEVRVDVEGEILADASRLVQLFENLFRNSVDHADSAVTVTVGGLPDGFFVEDDGPGVPAEVRDEAFEAGFSSATDGTGLGLSIVKEIAEAHGWRVALASGRGGGARFEVTGVETAAATDAGRVGGAE